jgi:hypothetical protein
MAPDTTIRYSMSDMVLHIHRDAFYLSESEARSRASGHLFLDTQPSMTRQRNTEPVHTISTILKNIMSSAAEAELEATFIKYGIIAPNWVPSIVDNVLLARVWVNSALRKSN